MLKPALRILLLSALLLPLWAGPARAAEAPTHHPVSEEMCRDPIQFVECFRFTKNRCLQEADLAVMSCIDRLPPRPPLPESDQPITVEQLRESDRGQWGLALGYCAEETFALWNDGHLAKSSWCQDLMKQAANRHSQSHYQWEHGALRPLNRQEQAWNLVQVVLPPLVLALLLPLSLFHIIFILMTARGVTSSTLVWIRNMLYPLTWMGAVLGDVVGHLWNPNVYASLSTSPDQVGGLLIALGVSPVYFVLVWLLHRVLRSEHSEHQVAPGTRF